MPYDIIIYWNNRIAAYSRSRIALFWREKTARNGQGVKQFKEGMKDVTEPIEESINPKEQNNSDSQTEQSNKTDNLTHSESKKQEVDEAQGK